MQVLSSPIFSQRQFCYNLSLWDYNGHSGAIHSLKTNTRSKLIACTFCWIYISISDCPYRRFVPLSSQPFLWSKRHQHVRVGRNNLRPTEKLSDPSLLDWRTQKAARQQNSSHQQKRKLDTILIKRVVGILISVESVNEVTTAPPPTPFFFLWSWGLPT